MLLFIGILIIVCSSVTCTLGEKHKVIKQPVIFWFIGMTTGIIAGMLRMM